MTTFKFVNNSADPTLVFGYSSNAITVTLGATTWGYTQSFDVLIPYNGNRFNKYARIVIRPTQTYDYQTPVALATRACPDQIYPFVSGVTYYYSMRAATMDDYGNHLICGETKPSFYNAGAT